MSERLLVVGGDGVLGSALAREWRAGGGEVVVTTRRTGGAGALRLDLAEDERGWSLPGGSGIAVLCAAVTAQAECRRDPAATRRVNVVGTVRLARALGERGWFVVFLSTSLVFDGSTPLPSPEDPVSPATEYGRQKAEAEASILEAGSGAAVVRVTKVLHPAMPLLRGWIGALERGEEIRPFSDLGCAPVSLGYATEALRRIALSRGEGIWHVSGGEELSYAELARRLARRLGRLPLVRPWTVAESGIAVEPVGPFSALGAERLRAAFALDPQDVESVLDEILA